MPTYSYRCEANNQIYEVRHAMDMTISSWQELQPLIHEIDATIPADAAVTKVLMPVNVVKSSALKNPEAPACASRGCSGSCLG